MIRDKNIDPIGLSSKSLRPRMQYCILKPDVATNSIVAAADISGGAVAAATLAKTRLDYPRNLLYTLTDNSSNTLEAVFVVTGTDQFGNTVTETATVDYSASATTNGTQIFATISSISITPTNQAASDTADVGVSITANVASFGLPDEIAAVTDVKNITWIDNGVVKPEDIDSTSVVIARNCFRPGQTVEVIDDYIITYKNSTDCISTNVQ